METSVVSKIHIAPASRLPMKPVNAVVAEAGRGLVGDRYHGTRHRHVTIQSLEQLHEAAEIFGSDIEPEMTRRNVTVSKGNIPTIPGTRVQLGDVELEVVRVAAPCRLLEDVIGRGAVEALRNRAGAVFRVLTDGEISVGLEFRIQAIRDLSEK